MQPSDKEQSAIVEGLLDSCEAANKIRQSGLLVVLIGCSLLLSDSIEDGFLGVYVSDRHFPIALFGVVLFTQMRILFSYITILSGANQLCETSKSAFWLRVTHSPWHLMRYPCIPADATREEERCFWKEVLEAVVHLGARLSAFFVEAAIQLLESRPKKAESANATE